MQPVDAQHDVVRAQRNAVAIDGEHLCSDIDLQVLTTSWRCDAVAISHRDLEARTPTQRDRGALHSSRIHEIVGGARIQQCREAGAVDEDDELHGALRPWLNAREGVQGDGGCRLDVVCWWHRIIRIEDDFDRVVLLVDVALALCVQLVTLEALPFASVLADLRRGQVLGG
jgi:hypothetical protein